MPHSPEYDTRAFLLTVSVKGDLSPECQDGLVKYLTKYTFMHHVVIEHGESGKRHLHACFIFKDSRHKAKIQSNVWDRHVKPFHPDSISRYAVKVQVCPGNDWYTEYLRKEQNVEVLATNWDPEAAKDHFPTQQVQEALQSKSKLASVAAPHIKARVVEWTASSEFENTVEGAIEYLQHRMYVCEDMVPISDQRKLVEKATMFYKYRNQITKPNERERFLAKQMFDGPSYDVPGSIRDSSRGAASSI